MTIECLKQSLQLVDNYFGRQLSTDERKARTQVYASTLHDIPDDIAEKALLEALKVCRYQNQLLVDWCAEIRKLQAKTVLSASDLWQQTLSAARKIESNRYYQTHGGLVTSEGKLQGDDFRRENERIFAELPKAVQEWAGSYLDLLAMLDRPADELMQFVRPSFNRAVEAASVDKLEQAQLEPKNRMEIGE